MLLESHTSYKFLFGSGNIILSIMIVYGFPECVMYELDDASTVIKGNLIGKAPPMCMPSKSVRGINN